MKKAFSLIELLTVIAIIAILASVVTFNLSVTRKNAQKNAAKTDVSSMMVEYETYSAAKRGVLPTALKNRAYSTGSLAAWENLWTTGTFGKDKAPMPPQGSGIVYILKTDASGAYTICAGGGPFSGTFWVGKNGNASEAASCN